MQVASGSTPFRLNLHVDDVGHTLIFGPTGSGKSTLLALIAAQFRRYARRPDVRLRQRQLDAIRSRWLSAAIITRSAAIVQEGKALAFCPLSELRPTATGPGPAEWIETLIALQGVTVHPEHRNAISTANRR